MGLKYIIIKITTGSLSYCPYWSDCGTIASYCRAIAEPARQPSFPYSLIRVIPSFLTAAPLPSPVPAVRQQGAGPLPGASTQPRETRKKGQGPKGFPSKPRPKHNYPKPEPESEDQPVASFHLFLLSGGLTRALARRPHPFSVLRRLRLTAYLPLQP